jgi:hypothetical protein
VRGSRPVHQIAKDAGQEQGTACHVEYDATDYLSHSQHATSDMTAAACLSSGLSEASRSAEKKALCYFDAEITPQTKVTSHSRPLPPMGELDAAW